MEISFDSQDEAVVNAFPMPEHVGIGTCGVGAIVAVNILLGAKFDAAVKTFPVPKLLQAAY